MKVTIISVGKKHDPKLTGAIEAYEQRLSPFVKIGWELVSNSDVTAESAKIMSLVGATSPTILLDGCGTQLNNKHFVETLQLLQNSSTKELFIIIGGAYGVNEQVRNRANYVWSISGLVLPHQLVRLILIEQLYRSYSIIHGGKYHHS